MERAIRYVVPALAVCLTALFSHYAIDVLGDVVLAHDAYDDVQHGSRLVVAGGAVLASLAALCGAFLWALAHAGRAGALRPLTDALQPQRRLAHYAFVLMVSLVVLVAMGSTDALAGAHRVPDPIEALGGSLPFALAIVAITSATVCALLRRMGTALLARRESILRALAAMCRLLFASEPPRPCFAVRPLLVTAHSGSRLGRRGANRAPPARPFATP